MNDPTVNVTRHTGTLETRGVTKTFVTRDETVEVLRGIDALFHAGTSYTITGASGSGKSTLMHILAGLDKPTSGTVYFNGIDGATLTDRSKDMLRLTWLATMFQVPYLVKELSVVENVSMRGLIAGLDNATCVARSQELLEAVGLADKASCKPAMLSGGQQQRVALARALFCRPVFVLADEPTGNLDEKASCAIVNVLLHYQRKYGTGIIVCSHDRNLARALDVTYRLEQGLLGLHRSS